MQRNVPAPHAAHVLVHARRLARVAAVERRVRFRAGPHLALVASVVGAAGPVGGRCALRRVARAAVRGVWVALRVGLAYRGVVGGLAAVAAGAPDVGGLLAGRAIAGGVGAVALRLRVAVVLRV